MDFEDWILEDGFGEAWYRCSPDCELEVVRPGKVQCSKPDCPNMADRGPHERP